MTSLQDASTVAVWTRRLKMAALGTRRLVAWQTRPEAFPPPRVSIRPLEHLVWSTRVRLSRPGEHPVFEAGKRHNLALAAPRFDGVELAAGETFSFWRTLGRVTEAGGYRYGMELSGGCIVPAIGGGLCLLARVLFQAAAYAGLRIDERHGHSMEAVEPPPGVPRGLDATVLWPYVDLRFSAVDRDVRFGVQVRDEALVLSVTSDRPLDGRIELDTVDERITHEADGRIRTNRVVRRWPTDAGVREESLGSNRTRLLSPERQQRNCLTCGEVACRSRVEVR